MISLEPFVLEKPIGRGGMAEVWAAKHREQGVPVAVKVLTTEKTRDPMFVSAFKNEVRAVAGLNHPNIVMVFDYGQLPEETEKQSEGKLRAGSPYLVMERADGGSLRALCGKLMWEDMKQILLSLLDALAHAHARGVIHRDLKPKNVLYCRSRNAWIITDFGLAHAVGQENLSPWEEETVMGTPTYMAPEQFECRWRDYGPWTDLYSFGCLAYALASGNPPFSGAQSVPKLMFAHTRLPVPDLKPKMPVPEGFEAWIKRLMEKDPAHRFRRAADAAWALLRLGDPVIPTMQLLPTAPPFSPSLSPYGLPQDKNILDSDELNSVLKHSSFNPDAYDLSAQCVMDAADDSSETIPQIEEMFNSSTFDSQTLPGLGEFLTMSDEEDSQTLAGFNVNAIALYEDNNSDSSESMYQQNFTLPPLPSTWRRPPVERPPIRLMGAGLGLYGLRSIPLVGREKERDLLWQTMKKVREHGEIHAVLLKGAAGCGKSRIAEWLCERVHEVGTARVLKGVHSPDSGPADGIEPMISRYMRCTGLKREEVLERTCKILQEQGVSDPDEWNALTEIISPATKEDIAAGARIIRFSNVTERYVLLQRFLERQSRKRPIVIWLDDIHWGLESLHFILYLFENQKEHYFPVLIILTAREEALAEHEEVSQLLQKLLEFPNTREVEIGPLDPKDRSALVRELLGLEGELAALVEEKTNGNPLFAVQLVGDWVERGLLELGPFGFRLKKKVEAFLPDDLHQVWAARVDRLLENYSKEAGYALELAAVLGQEVDCEEWHEVCQLADLEVPRNLLEALFAQRLALNEEDNAGGWSFVHSMLRESLERRAREGKRWKWYQRICAKMLKDKKGYSVPERLGRHLIAAGQGEEALEHLLAGARMRIEIGDYHIAKNLLSQWKQTMENLQIPMEDERWGHGWVLWSKYAISQGFLEQADDWALRVEKAARQHNWKTVRAYALRERGRISREKGEVAKAWRRLQEAEVLAQQIGDRELLAHCRQDMGHVLADRGSHERAANCFLRAMKDFDAIQDEVGAGSASLGLGYVSIRSGDFEKASEHVKQAQKYFERCGSRSGVANCYNVLGEISRLQGNIEEAENYYRSSLDLYRLIGTGVESIPKMNLGLVLIDRGRFDEAYDVLEEGLDIFAEQGRKGILGALHTFLLPCAAHQNNWQAFDFHFSRARDLLKQTSLLDVDIARMAFLAGSIAQEHKKYHRAHMAFQLSLEQWQDLDRNEKVSEVRAALARLSLLSKRGR